ncbi:hypothetical protein M0805_003843 [Coniferiporia weirii]|nr:hypothetical protein M0805_003843 [Coniferiporia weirii]
MSGTLQSRSAPDVLVTLPDVLVSLASLEEEEKHLSSSLAMILSSSSSIQSSLDRLQSLTPYFDQVKYDAALLTNKFTATSRTARRVGGGVRVLDEEMRRVREAGERVGQIMELKNSIAGLRLAIDSMDWETATRLCARAMSLPTEVTSGPFAESAVPTIYSPLLPVQALQSYREKLRDVFLLQFQQASNARDSSMATRFFKLFPPIGWEQEGLEAYASFVLGLVQTKSPTTAKTSSPLYFVTALTALFESICNILDQHQPVVEKYYGQGKMQTVLRKLIQECDKEVKQLLDGWEEERSMNQKLAETAIDASSPSNFSSMRGQVFQSGSEGSVDPRGIDKILNEMAAMTTRFTAFRRFLYVNLIDRDLHEEPNSVFSPELPAIGLEMNELSTCKQLFDDLITKFYIPLEIWYLRYTINQALKSSTTDYSQVPPATTVPDLVFYILKSVLTRLLSMGSVRAVKGIIERICDVMENEFMRGITHKLDSVYRNAGNIINAGRGEKSEKEIRLSFIVLLNDLDISSSHVERLIRDFLSSRILAQSFFQQELDIIQSLLSSLLGLAPKFRFALKGGIDQFFNQLIRPHLRTFIPEVYKDVSYVLDEDTYSAAEYQDVVRKRFLKAWEGLIFSFKDSLTESNYRSLLNLAIDTIVRPWEKYVMSFKYTELGAIRFDQDIRAISMHLSSQVVFSDIKEKLQRLQQISTLLNVGKDEDVDDFFSSSGIAWKLSMTEAHAIARLKL